MKSTYLTAKQFLVRELAVPRAAEIVESYLAFPDRSNVPLPIDELFHRLLSSAQNANMKRGVIGDSIDGVHNLGKVLFDFDPRKVKENYKSDPTLLLESIVKTLQPRGQLRSTPQSLWPKYSKTILSAAAFFTQFRSEQDFYAWANYLYGDKRSMAALPMILAAEIEGIGYPLACDFLKELGFVKYGKPDVHLIEIFVGIGLCPARASPYQIQKVISQIADAAEVSAYAVDKVFWLIGSGKFHNHPEIGRLGGPDWKKVQFIAEFIKT